MGDIIHKFAALGLGALLTLSSVTKADSIGYSALGDSYADEYQFYLPDRSTDMNGLSQQILNSPTFSVGGVTLDRTTPADQYNHLLLADGLHISTVGQGLLANAFVDAADTKFGAGITPLSAAEIIPAAESTAPAAVPLPPTWEMGLVGLLLVAPLSLKCVRRIFI
jgi:hypothetical protein